MISLPLFNPFRGAGTPRIDLRANPRDQVKDAVSRAAERSLRDGVPVYIDY